MNYMSKYTTYFNVVTGVRAAKNALNNYKLHPQARAVQRTKANVKKRIIAGQCCYVEHGTLYILWKCPLSQRYEFISYIPIKQKPIKLP